VGAGQVNLPPGTADEAELDRAFAAHDRGAFDRAYERYGRLLYSAAYNVLHVREEAEDCMHDALARVWKNPHAYTTQRGSVRNFLAVCVRNEAISRMRKAATRSGAERRAALPERSEDPEPPDFIERERLQRAIALLPDDQRQALCLAYFQGKTHVQIARQLGAPLGTVKGRLALAVRKLSRALQGDAP
jgi:RNA polymerase sigma-70 factor (ECF subfamily)